MVVKNDASAKLAECTINIAVFQQMSQSHNQMRFVGPFGLWKCLVSEPSNDTEPTIHLDTSIIENSTKPISI